MVTYKDDLRMCRKKISETNLDVADYRPSSEIVNDRLESMNKIGQIERSKLDSGMGLKEAAGAHPSLIRPNILVLKCMREWVKQKSEIEIALLYH